MPRSSPFADRETLEEKARTAYQRLVGSQFGTPELEVESPLERVATLSRHLSQLAEPPTNPYQTDFHAFLTRLVWTKDEAAGGRVARFPEWPYIQDICDDLILRPKLFFEKSRRVLATWAACAFDVWVAGGGQDPRWPTLMYATGNRQVFLCHRKFEDSNKYLRERVWFVIDELSRRRVWDDWPDFPQWHWKEGEISASNGSLITAVAQGSDQTRGFAATALHLEELAFWENAQETVEGALHTLRGGGHVYAITTPKANTYAKHIRDGKIASGTW
jgi:hypothetical protein